ncbi:hypothetical protein Q4508_12460 [Amphritea sp. 2_MG-2023]|uniref:hypothetical protein n=1 Tax=Amphritea TaxID=515417 RepID=UPI001C07B3BB|nr:MULTISPECIES: hypothetical protein [Amphritea]MBU2967083.1 hypothetical protein [Amphritea atlantica]MDO6419364.1 hypothetical protein [Amphritea sp. 2_MG-2023]
MNYLIINLPMTQQAQQLIFWGARSHFDTPDPHKAMVINEEYVNINLERYDNGSTTRAVSQNDAINRPNEIFNALGIPKSNAGEAA